MNDIVLSLESVYVKSEKSYLESISLSLRESTIIAIHTSNKQERETMIEFLMGMKEIQSGVVRIGEEEIQNMDCVERLERGLAVILSRCEATKLMEDKRIEQESAIGYVKIPCCKSWDSDKQSGSKRVARHFKKKHLYLSRGTGDPKLFLISLCTASTEREYKEQQNFLKILKEWKSEGAAILLFPEQIKDVFSIADQICIIREGLIVGHVKNEKQYRQDSALWEEAERR